MSAVGLPGRLDGGATAPIQRDIHHERITPTSLRLKLWQLRGLEASDLGGVKMTPALWRQLAYWSAPVGLSASCRSGSAFAYDVR